MRAPTRPVRHRHRNGGGAVALFAGALALAAAGIGSASPASAALPTVNVVDNSHFDQGNRMLGWNCESGRVYPSSTFGVLDGYPTDSSYAGCTQTVPVEPNSTYTLDARVTGPYVFVGVTGSGTTDTTLWSNQNSWNVLSGTVTTGPGTTSLTVYFHGWYQQGPYEINYLELWGPGQGHPTCIPYPGVAQSPSPSPCYLTPTSTPRPSGSTSTLLPG